MFDEFKELLSIFNARNVRYLAAERPQDLADVAALRQVAKAED
jgi:hypothetical protein